MMAAETREWVEQYLRLELHMARMLLLLDFSATLGWSSSSSCGDNLPVATSLSCQLHKPLFIVIAAYYTPPSLHIVHYFILNFNIVDFSLIMNENYQDNFVLESMTT
jgi:hypothetical protein